MKDRLTPAQQRAYERLPGWLAQRWLDQGARLIDLDRLRDRDFARWLADHAPVREGGSFAQTLHRLAEEYREERACRRFERRTGHLSPAEGAEVAATLARLSQKYLFVPPAIRGGGTEPELGRLRAQWRGAYAVLRQIERGNEPLMLDELRGLEAELDHLTEEIEQLWRGTGERPRSEGARFDQPGEAAIFARLHLLPDAPYAVAYAAYRALARIYHPDHGGDAEQMQELNVAWEAIRGIYRYR